jgi:hypothetical protein
MSFGKMVKTWIAMLHFRQYCHVTPKVQSEKERAWSMGLWAWGMETGKYVSSG